MKRLALYVLFCFFVSCSWSMAQDKTIRIGVILPLSGMFEDVGAGAKNGVMMLYEEQYKDGVEIGGEKYLLDFVILDNKSDPTISTGTSLKMIANENAIGVVGGLSSRQAVPMSEIFNAYKTPLISPWSGAPNLTQNKPWIFRTCVVFTMQTPALVKFIQSQYPNVKKGAILYDILSAYPREMAKEFRKSFEAQYGENSIVAYEEFRTGENSFENQLSRIHASGADFIFTPQHANEIPIIIKNARKMDIDVPFIGSGSWSGGDLLSNCGDYCNDSYFSANYSSTNSIEKNVKFVKSYKERFGTMPDEPIALTYDAINIMIQAIINTGGLSDNLLENRIAVRNQIAKMNEYSGVSGIIGYTSTGDPDRCIAIIKIKNGQFLTHKMICPE